MFCNSYTLACPPGRGDYSRAFEWIISRTVDKPRYNYFINVLVSVYLAQYEVVRAKVYDFWQE